MDFGQLGLDTTTFFSNNGEVNKHKCYGFGFLKQERAVNEDESREFKLARTCSSSRSNGGSEQNQQMLSFSSPQSPFYHHSSNAFARNTVGYGCTVGINGGSSMQEGVVRGPFTPSQWMELEHQALIYKYITANVPIPSYLLNPITKAFHSARFSAAFRSTALGWGGFQLGFANTDPEPGRCRRTDGKKWRCSRDAMPDQKYCERHMNRGRHRSRKPVEGQSAPVPPAANGRSSAAGGVSNTLGLSSVHPNPLSGLPRSLLDKENTNGGAYQHATASAKVGPKDYSAQQEFGLVCSDSLLNPLNTSVENKSQHALRQFMDDWPKTQLSISIPMVTSDFMSSTNEGLEMGLGVSSTDVDRDQRQTNWVPISWEPSMGGPLGEVLHTTGECKPLNLIDSPRLASSPTGVLQRGPFVSLSNSSAASSPRPESNGLINPSLPAL